MIIELPKESRNVVAFNNVDYQPRYTDGDKCWFFTYVRNTKREHMPQAIQQPKYIMFVAIGNKLIRIRVNDGLELAVFTPWKTLVETIAAIDRLDENAPNLMEQAKQMLDTLSEQHDIRTKDCDRTERRKFDRMVKSLKSEYREQLDPNYVPQRKEPQMATSRTAKRKPTTQPKQSAQKTETTTVTNDKATDIDSVTETVHVVTNEKNGTSVPIMAFKERARAEDLIDSMQMLAKLQGADETYGLSEIPLRA